ncbi:MAG: hypothetical protein V3S55_04570, partial [Nitrospiraceae bacterium]
EILWPQAIGQWAGGVDRVAAPAEQIGSVFVLFAHRSHRFNVAGDSIQFGAAAANTLTAGLTVEASD